MIITRVYFTQKQQAVACSKSELFISNSYSWSYLRSILFWLKYNLISFSWKAKTRPHFQVPCWWVLLNKPSCCLLRSCQMVCDQCSKSPVLLSKDSYWNKHIIGCRKPIIVLITSCQYLFDRWKLCICRDWVPWVCGEGSWLVPIDHTVCLLILSTESVCLLVFGGIFPLEVLGMNSKYIWICFFT